MRADEASYVRKCDHCQRKATISRVPAQNPMTITSPWPFAEWGIDIVGPLPTASARKKLLLVAIDYFRKLVEVEAFAPSKTKMSPICMEEHHGR